MLGVLQSFQHRRRPDKPHGHYRWIRAGLADLMRTRPSWIVLILEPVIVHADSRTDLGSLFGLLVDAPVQLVDVEDVARMSKFLELGKMSDATISAGFMPEELVESIEELQDAVKAVFGDVDKAPVMRPVVMFQLCTNKCLSRRGSRETNLNEKVYKHGFTYNS